VTVALVEDDPGTRSRFEAVIHAAPQLELAHSAAWARDMLAWLAATRWMCCWWTWACPMARALT
jgi:hypothetical protein